MALNEQEGVSAQAVATTPRPPTPVPISDRTRHERRDAIWRRAIAP